MSDREAQGPVLAMVDGSPITVDDLKAEMTRRGGAANFASREGLASLLEELVRLEVLGAKARRDGLDETYEARVEAKHQLAGQYRRVHLEPRLANIEVTDEEVEDFYDRHPERFAVPGAAHPALIYFSYGESASEERKRAVAELAAQVRAEALAQDGHQHFGALAVRHSDDQATRYRGGDAGWLSDDAHDLRWGANVVEAMRSLDPGELSEPIETPTGIYLVRVMATVPETLRPLNEVAAGIRQHLRAERARALTDEFYREAAAGVAVRVDEDRLAAIEIPKPAVAETERRPPPLPQS
jgi:peptidyl-prolyl cis-trans isomerase C